MKRNLPLYIFICFLGLGAISSFLSSCTKENLEDLVSGPVDTTGVVCDTSFMISYQNDIVPILEQNCYRCHNAANYQTWSTKQLDEYDLLKLKVNDGLLLCKIKHLCPPNMPYDRAEKIPECNILRIEAWINQGAKNN